MYRIILLFYCFLQTGIVQSQFPPAAGKEGSTAIKADSNCFIAWAVSAESQIGLRDISTPDSGFASIGSNNSVLGKALKDGVLSLGDAGEVTLYFSSGIVNGEGFDFAVFENAFNDSFLELAHVEISADGNKFFRFPSISLSETNLQTDAFGATYPEKIHNLAGKYRMPFGTPFDISEIDSNDNPLPPVFYYVRLIDVVGSISPVLGTVDSKGNLINDPWPTNFASSGFDLDAVGVINTAQTNSRHAMDKEGIRISQTESKIWIHSNQPLSDIMVYDFSGRNVLFKKANRYDTEFYIENLQRGSYIIKTGTHSQIIWVE